MGVGGAVAGIVMGSVLGAALLVGTGMLLLLSAAATAQVGTSF